MGPPSYMRSVVDRNVVVRRISVFTEFLNVFTTLWCTGSSRMRRIRGPYNAPRTTIKVDSYVRNNRYSYFCNCLIHRHVSTSL